MITDETFEKCGEIHFVWPHSHNGGNSSRCEDCRYFVEDEKQKEKSPYRFTGECHSKACETDTRHIFTRMVRNNGFCHWWFPVGKVAGEQEEFEGLHREER